MCYKNASNTKTAVFYVKYSLCGYSTWTGQHWASPTFSHCCTYTHMKLRRKHTDPGLISTLHLLFELENSSRTKKVKGQNAQSSYTLGLYPMFMWQQPVAKCGPYQKNSNNHFLNQIKVLFRATVKVAHNSPVYGATSAQWSAVITSRLIGRQWTKAFMTCWHVGSVSTLFMSKH